MKKYSSLVVVIVCGMILIVSGCSESGSSHSCDNNDVCVSNASCSEETGSCVFWESPLAISPNYTWKDATVGNPYEVDFEASGGIPPYTWILNNGDPTAYPYPSWLVLTPAGDNNSKAKLQNIASQYPPITEITQPGASISIKITVKDNTKQGSKDRSDNKEVSINQALKINGCLTISCEACSGKSDLCNSNQYQTVECNSQNNLIRKCWADPQGCVVWTDTDLSCNTDETCTVSDDGTVTCICNIGSTNCHRCNKDSDCQNGSCECANKTCSATQCSTVSCNCGYTTDGSACAGKLDPDLNDTHDTCGLGSCDGNGNCRKADGVACSNSSECRPKHYCECGTFDCSPSNWRCSSKACKCQYVDSSGQNCAGFIPYEQKKNDAVGRCGVSDFCNGHGDCTVPDTTTCTDDYKCRSNHCECVDPDCNGKRCGEAYCFCQYNSDSGPNCTNYINKGKDDAHQSCGNLHCNGLGGCIIPNGQACNADLACDSNHCGCATASCNPPVCVTRECGACWEITCNQTVERGRQNPGQCDGIHACNGIGECKLTIGQPCTGNSDCASSCCGIAGCNNTCALSTCTCILSP